MPSERPPRALTLAFRREAHPTSLIHAQPGFRHPQVELGIDVDALTGRGDLGDLGDDLSALFVALGAAAADQDTGVVSCSTRCSSSITPSSRR